MKVVCRLLIPQTSTNPPIPPLIMDSILVPSHVVAKLCSSDEPTEKPSHPSIGWEFCGICLNVTSSEDARKHRASHIDRLVSLVVYTNRSKLNCRWYRWDNICPWSPCANSKPKHRDNDEQKLHFLTKQFVTLLYNNFIPMLTIACSVAPEFIKYYSSLLPEGPHCWEVNSELDHRRFQSNHSEKFLEDCDPQPIDPSSQPEPTGLLPRRLDLADSLQSMIMPMYDHSVEGCDADELFPEPRTLARDSSTRDLRARSTARIRVAESVEDVEVDSLSNAMDSLTVDGFKRPLPKPLAITKMPHSEIALL